MAHDEEAGGVDAVSQLFQPGQFPVGHDAQQHGAGLVGVAALAVEDGHAAVELLQNGLADGVGDLGADRVNHAGQAAEDQVVLERSGAAVARDLGVGAACQR